MRNPCRILIIVDLVQLVFGISATGMSAKKLPQPSNNFWALSQRVKDARMTLTKTLILFLITGIGFSAENEIPKIVQDQLNVIKPTLERLQAEYAKKVMLENDKLIKLIQLTMDKETRAGNLEAAMALKTALPMALDGKLIDPYLHPDVTDLLGNKMLPANDFSVAVFRSDSNEFKQAIAVAKSIERQPEGSSLKNWIKEGISTKWSPALRCSALILVTRKRGNAEDSWSNVSFVVNKRTTCTINKIDSEQMIVISSPSACLLSDLSIMFTAQKNDPQITGIFMIP